MHDVPYTVDVVENPPAAAFAFALGEQAATTHMRKKKTKHRGENSASTSQALVAMMLAHTPRPVGVTNALL